MHTYAALWPEDEVGELPELEQFRFNSADDVVAWAQRDRTIGWMTWPEVWHLDDEGAFRCYYKAFSRDSIRRWAEDPTDLHRSRQQCLAEGECAGRWLIVESRPTWHVGEPTVDERDAEAFGSLRRELASIGVTLVDAVIFDDARHWWSMHELTSGAATWPPPSAMSQRR